MARTLGFWPKVEIERVPLPRYSAIIRVAWRIPLWKMSV